MPFFRTSPWASILARAKHWGNAMWGRMTSFLGIACRAVVIIREYELREELEEPWAALMFADFSAIELVRADKLRALAVATATRSEVLPNLPDRGRIRTWLRGERLVWHGRA
jgi:hypothetical protein